MLPEPAEFEEVKQYCKEIYYYKIDGVDLVINMISNLGAGYPLQVGSLYHKFIARDIVSKIELFGIDIAYCQLIRMAPYAEHLKIPVVLDFMDAFGVGMKRRASASKGLWKWLYKYESQKVLEYEYKISQKFEAYTIISKPDLKIINVSDRAKVKVVSNGIDCDYFKAKNVVQPVYDVVFIGNLGYIPNVEAAEILVNQIGKVYEEKYGKSLRILLSGARPANRVWNLESDNTDIKPWREDIRSAYEDGKLLVAPLFNGTGQQNKILEAMAMGLPCITTSFVNEAILGKNGDHLLVSDDIHEMVAAIHLLLNDDELFDKIRGKARQFVEDNYDWANNVAKLNAIFVAILNKIDVF